MDRIRREFQKVYYNLDKILLLFFVSFTVMEFVWIPLNSWLAEFLLSLTGHAYLSPTNVLQVLSSNLFVTVLFALLIILNILVAYLEIALIFTGVRQLLDNRVKHLRDYIKDVGRDMVRIISHTSLPKISFLLCYATVLLPFLRRILNIYYFNKLVIPQFVLDYLEKNNLVALVIALSLLVFSWLSARLMYAIPKIYFEHRGVKESVAHSWHQTRGWQQLASYARLLWTMTLPGLVILGVGLTLYLFQLLVDKTLPSLAYPLALLSFILFRLTYYGAIAMFMTKFVTLLTGQHLPSYRRKRLRHRLRLLIVVSSALLFGLDGALSLYYPFESLPVTISHRGVDDENGVQNTLESLELTAQLRPDFVEMDIQETKDGQFVVMHDTNLLALTGNTGGTHDYSLQELTSMTASENGQSAPVPSFDAYLDKADQLGQKLLVEIKETKQDSPDLAKNFVKKYGKRLLAKGHQFHSLDYQIIVEIEKVLPQLKTYLILPFNSIYPQTVADGYTMEYTSLDQNFMMKSWLRGKSVYVWTPNDEDEMTRMAMLQVDGIITDQLESLQRVEDSLRSTTRYADLFLLQVESLLYGL